MQIDIKRLRRIADEVRTGKTQEKIAQEEMDRKNNQIRYEKMIEEIPLLAEQAAQEGKVFYDLELTEKDYHVARNARVFPGNIELFGVGVMVFNFCENANLRPRVYFTHKDHTPKLVAFIRIQW